MAKPGYDFSDDFLQRGHDKARSAGLKQQIVSDILAITRTFGEEIGDTGFSINGLVEFNKGSAMYRGLHVRDARDLPIHYKNMDLPDDQKIQLYYQHGEALRGAVSVYERTALADQASWMKRGGEQIRQDLEGLQRAIATVRVVTGWGAGTEDVQHAVDTAANQTVAELERKVADYRQAYDRSQKVFAEEAVVVCGEVIRAGMEGRITPEDVQREVKEILDHVQKEYGQKGRQMAEQGLQQSLGAMQQEMAAQLKAMYDACVEGRYGAQEAQARLEQITGSLASGFSVVGVVQNQSSGHVLGSQWYRDLAHDAVGQAANRFQQTVQDDLQNGTNQVETRANMMTSLEMLVGFDAGQHIQQRGYQNIQVDARAATSEEVKGVFSGKVSGEVLVDHAVARAEVVTEIRHGSPVDVPRLEADTLLEVLDVRSIGERAANTQLKNAAIVVQKPDDKQAQRLVAAMDTGIEAIRMAPGLVEFPQLVGELNRAYHGGRNGEDLAKGAAMRIMTEADALAKAITGDPAKDAKKVEEFVACVEQIKSFVEQHCGDSIDHPTIAAVTGPKIAEVASEILAGAMYRTGSAMLMQGNVIQPLSPKDQQHLQQALGNLFEVAATIGPCVEEQMTQGFDAAYDKAMANAEKNAPTPKKADQQEKNTAQIEANKEAIGELFR